MSTTTESINAISSNTIIVHGRKMEANTLLNIPSVAKSHGMKDLRDKFAGCTAVLAGAGPSLDAAIPHLKAHYGEYLLIAVDRALKPMLAAGLIPHIVCTSDMDAILMDLFTGYDIPDSVALLWDRDCYYEVPAMWKGPLITYDHYYDVGIWQSAFFGHRGFLCKNFTVSHTAFYVASTMGCSNVVMTGVDFAFPSKTQHHVAGAVEVGTEAKEMEVYNWVDIPGNILPSVRTTEVFSICIPSMTNAIEEAPWMKCWNTSTIGARIHLAEFKAIEDALVEFSKPEDYTKRMADCFTAPEIDLHAFGVHSRYVIQTMDNILEDSTNAIDIMKRLKKIDGLRNKLLFPKWRSVFMQSVKLRDKILSDTFSQYLLQRCMLACVHKCKEMLRPVAHLAQMAPERLAVDCSRHTMLFWQFGENAKLFIHCLQRARLALGLDPVETKWRPEPEKVTA